MFEKGKKSFVEQEKFYLVLPFSLQTCFFDAQRTAVKIVVSPFLQTTKTLGIDKQVSLPYIPHLGKMRQTKKWQTVFFFPSPPRLKPET